MTEREFVEWVDDKTRAEWVDGEVIVIPPVSIGHDELGFGLRTVFQDFVEHHDLGRVFGPEVMVRLPRHRRRRVPDVLFVSRAKAAIIHANLIEGIPDIIIEIVSPESVSRDWRDKYLDYERAGVREYWVIDRQNERVELYALRTNGRFRRVADKAGKLFSTVLPKFYLRTVWLLSSGRPTRRSVLRELGVPG